MHEVLVNRLGGLSLPRKSVVRLTDRPDMTLDVYRGRKTIQQILLERKLLLDLFRAGHDHMRFIKVSWRYDHINSKIGTPKSYHSCPENGTF